MLDWRWVGNGACCFSRVLHGWAEDRTRRAEERRDTCVVAASMADVLVTRARPAAGAPCRPRLDELRVCRASSGVEAEAVRENTERGAPQVPFRPRAAGGAASSWYRPSGRASSEDWKRSIRAAFASERARANIQPTVPSRCSVKRI
ncbi:uncharacterized protein LOC134541274 isoform X2 [Bacillus rossius redtenbacheri]|uniref:uncharacterized protein LOC134541274 isoform X2 n=1 Tax=Bacillus rossius redtenbacheri TaxID=93214 RepID=UPI002FDEC458